MSNGYNKIISNRYYKESKKFRETYGAAEWQETFRLIDFPLKGRVVLDAGSGFGYQSNLLHSKGAKVFGIDASAQLISTSGKNYPDLADSFFVGDIRNLSFRNNFFDLIICKYVLHYLPLPDLAFEEFFRCLKRHGLLIFTVHHPVSTLFFKEPKNYFKKDKIRVEIFPEVWVTQTAHTLNDYFSEYFLNHFDILYFKEGRDFKPLHTEINVPDYFLVKACKRSV